VGQAYDPTCIMDCDFPETMKKDLQDCAFNRRIICEYNNKETIERKIANLLEREINPYNNEPEKSPVEYDPVEEEIIFEAPFNDIEEYDIEWFSNFRDCS